MFRRIDRYLWRELLPTFGVALLAFLVFIGLDLVLSLSNTLFAHGVKTSDVLALLSYKLPSVLVLAIPAGVLLAVFIALARLSTSRELLGFQALGYSLRRIIVPFLAFGLAASGVSFALSELAVPPAEVAYRTKLLSILYRGQIPSLEQDVFFRGPEGELYYIAHYHDSHAYGIVVYDLHGQMYPHSGPYPVVITAKDGRFVGDKLELFQGRIVRFDQQGRLDQEVGFDSLSLTVGEEIQRGLLGGRTPSEMSIRELLARVKLFRKTGLDPRNLLVELHSKLALGAASLVFTLLGAPLGVLLGRRGRAAGAVAGFLLVSAAQGLFIWTRALAKQGTLPPALGAWLPHILIAGFGVWLLLSVDRLRVRGFWGLLVGLIVISSIGLAAPPPFQELSAQSLTIQSGAEVLKAQGVEVVLKDWKLSAAEFTATWTGDRWEVEAQSASLSGRSFSLDSANLLAEVNEEGTITQAMASSFSGSSSFQGTSGKETLIFRGKWGQASFQGGEISRVEGRAVRFTTCPCLEGAPYEVEAARFILIPKEWLYAEGVTVKAFGRAVGWLPVYAARLGKESSPLFPEIGRMGGNWFLRWYIPFALKEGMSGAVSLTWLPALGKADPGLRLYWQGGSLVAKRGSLQFTATSELWKGKLSLSQRETTASFSGKLGQTAWSLTWGKTKSGSGRTYWRLPEFSLQRSVDDWLGGRLSLSLSGGRYAEETGSEEGGGGEGEPQETKPCWKAAWGLRWTKQLDLGPLHLSLPWQFFLSQYPGAQQVTASLSPRATIGGLGIAYSGRLSWGQSPFSFDRAPPQSRLSVSLSARLSELSETLTLNWDLAKGKSLPSSWVIKSKGLDIQGRFRVAPLVISRISWSFSPAISGLKLRLSGGMRLAPFAWDDLLLKASFTGWDGYGSLRLSPWPLFLKRLYITGSWNWGPDWAFQLVGEYDFFQRKLAQLRASVLRTFSGCLRLGLEVSLKGIRLVLEVPAFPQAKVSFAPLDEGLRLGD